MEENVKIIIGDKDIANLQKLLNTLFEAGFHNTPCVITNTELQDCIEREIPELIIIDWNFDLPNCIDTVKALHSQLRYAEAEFIITSKAKLSHVELKLLADCEGADYIHLNGNFNEFLMRMNMVLLRKRNRKRMLAELIALREKSNNESSKELEYSNAELCNSNKKLQHELTCMQLRILQYNELHKKMLYSLQQHKMDNDSANKKCQKRIGEWIHQINQMQNSTVWKELKERVDSVHSGFYNRLLRDFPQLSEMDLRLLSLIKLYLTTKEIAAISNQSINTIKAARRRVRQKLNIKDKSMSLLRFLVDYD